MFDLKRKATRTPIPSTSSVVSHRQNLSGAAVKPDDRYKPPSSFSHASNYSSRFKASSSTNSQSNTRGVTKLPNTSEPSHASCQKDIYNDAASPKNSFKLNAPSKAPKLQCNSGSSPANRLLSPGYSSANGAAHGLLSHSNDDRQKLFACNSKTFSGSSRIVQIIYPKNVLESKCDISHSVLAVENYDALGDIKYFRFSYYRGSKNGITSTLKQGVLECEIHRDFEEENVVTAPDLVAGVLNVVARKDLPITEMKVTYEFDDNTGVDFKEKWQQERNDVYRVANKFFESMNKSKKGSPAKPWGFEQLNWG